MEPGHSLGFRALSWSAWPQAYLSQGTLENASEDLPSHFLETKFGNGCILEVFSYKLEQSIELNV